MKSGTTCSCLAPHRSASASSSSPRPLMPIPLRPPSSQPSKSPNSHPTLRSGKSSIGCTAVPTLSASAPGKAVQLPLPHPLQQPTHQGVIWPPPQPQKQHPTTTLKVHGLGKPRTLDHHLSSPATTAATAPTFVAGDIKGVTRRGPGRRPDKPPASLPTGQGNLQSPVHFQTGDRPAPEQRPPGIPLTMMPSSMGAPLTVRQPHMTAPPVARPLCLPTLATPQVGGTAHPRDPPPTGQRLGTRHFLTLGPTS